MSKTKQSRLHTHITEVQEVITRAYPTLWIVSTEPTIVIKGVFPVYSETEVLDQFLVQITLPDAYPTYSPVVKELGGRIPIELDRHVIPSTEDLCLFLPDERWRWWKPEDGFEAFLKKPLNDFFLNQLYFEKHKKFPFGDRRHGIEGTIDFYFEELQTRDIRVVICFLDYLSRQEVKGHWKCYCGSEVIMRKCHWRKLLELRANIPQHVAERSLFLIREFIQQMNENRKQNVDQRRWIQQRQST